jgi:hypothetical protein
LALYRELLDRLALEEGMSYNLLATSRWLMVVPRTKEDFETEIVQGDGTYTTQTQSTRDLLALGSRVVAALVVMRRRAAAGDGVGELGGLHGYASGEERSAAGGHQGQRPHERAPGGGSTPPNHYHQLLIAMLSSHHALLPTQDEDEEDYMLLDWLTRPRC